MSRLNSCDPFLKQIVSKQKVASAPSLNDAVADNRNLSRTRTILKFFALRFLHLHV